MCFALRWPTKRSGGRVLDSNDDVIDSFTTSKKRVFDALKDLKPFSQGFPTRGKEFGGVLHILRGR